MKTTRAPIHAGIAIGPILFVVAILAVLVGAIASGSGGFGSSTADESARVRAGSIIQQAINIKNGTDRMSVNGEDSSTIRVAETGFTATSTAALYGTAGGGITVQAPPKEAVPSGATWRFVSDATLQSIGASGANDFITVLKVTQATCVALNDIIFGRGTYTASTIPIMATTPPTVTIAAATADNVTPTSNAFDLGTGFTAALAGRTAACVSDNASTPSYYFYQLLTAG